MAQRYSGNSPSNVSKEMKYSVKRSPDGWEIRVIHRLSAEEKALVTTADHPRLVELVNSVKEDHQGAPGGAFYIDEYRHVLIPTDGGCMFAGYYDQDLLFRFEGQEIGPRPPAGLEPDEAWPGPRVGIPYTLSADGRDIWYKAETGPSVVVERRLSKETGAAAAARLAGRLARIKPTGGKIYINEAQEFFAPIERGGEWVAVYLGSLGGDDWFADPLRSGLTGSPSPDLDVSAPHDYWGSLGQLWARATGGGDVAANPTDANDAFPRVLPAPGVDEVCAWLSEGLLESAQRLAFLVGGPGAGKSHAASLLVEGLTCLTPSDDGLAERTYRYATGGPRDLLVINDATISSEAHRDGALAADIRDALDNGWHVLACVNRGVIVQELPLLEARADAAIAGIIRWLHDDAVNDTDPVITSSPSTAVNGDAAYVRVASLQMPGQAEIDIACVFLDVCSLLEKRPRVELGVSIEGGPLVEASPYCVTRLRDRPDLIEGEVPGAELVAEVVGRIPNCPPSDGLDPIAANIESLRNSHVRTGLLTILRAAEITSSQRFTFREVWGALARSLVGGLTGEINPEDLESKLARMQPVQSDHPVDRLSSVRCLAGLRFSQAIYAADSPDWADSPVARLTHRIDPARDAVPGFAWEDDSGWASPVIDAFVGSEQMVSPLNTVLSAVPDDDRLHDVVTDFDRSVDEAVLVALQPLDALQPGPKRPTDAERREIVAWYGAYLQRLYATAHGIPAFLAEIELWSEAWHMAPQIPVRLNRALRDLLFPRRNPDDPRSTFLLPVMEGRMRPVQGERDGDDARLAVRTSQVQLKTARRGDALALLLLAQDSSELARIDMDFPLVREAMACADGHLGVTEFVHVAFPRLERLWATRLAPSRLGGAEFVLVHDGLEKTVSIEGWES